MSRTTKKTDNNEYVVDNYISLNEPWKTPINKLGVLENIEDEISVDLVIKDKVEQSSYCYYKELDGTVVRGLIVGYSRLSIFVIQDCDDDELGSIELPYNEYGKTWSLEREDLK